MELLTKLKRVRGGCIAEALFWDLKFKRESKHLECRKFTRISMAGFSFSFSLWCVWDSVVIDCRKSVAKYIWTWSIESRFYLELSHCIEHMAVKLLLVKSELGFSWHSTVTGQSLQAQGGLQEVQGKVCYKMCIRRFQHLSHQNQFL